MLLGTGHQWKYMNSHKTLGEDEEDPARQIGIFHLQEAAEFTQEAGQLPQEMKR